MELFIIGKLGIFMYGLKDQVDNAVATFAKNTQQGPIFPPGPTVLPSYLAVGIPSPPMSSLLALFSWSVIDSPEYQEDSHV
jgi:hypothetical protein